MKNYLIVAVIFLTIASCKKDRTCSCTVTKTGTSTTTGKAEIELFPGFPTPLADTSFATNVNETQIVDTKIEKVTKYSAKNKCYSYTQPYDETTLTSVPASSFNLVVSVNEKGNRHYSCSLQ